MNEVDKVVPSDSQLPIMPELGVDIELREVGDIKSIENDPAVKKMTISQLQKMKVGALCSQLPSIMSVGTMAQAYIAVFPDGMNHALTPLRQGGVCSFYKDSRNHFSGTASLYSVKSQALILGAFTAMSIASSQYFLTEINSSLRKINQNLDRILEFLYGDKRAELISEISFIKYAYQNYSSIMEHSEQRLATISSLQNARKVAMKDIEFYISDLDSIVHTKDIADLDSLVNRAIQIKESLELSMQLYSMGSILESYYSQNGDESFLRYIEQDVTTYIDKCEKRMLSSFSALQVCIANFKTMIPLKKIDKSVLDKSVQRVIDSFNTGEESEIKKVFQTALKAVFERKCEYIICKTGDVYLRSNA